MGAHLREKAAEYMIEIDVSDVDERRLAVETLGTLEIHAPHTWREPHRPPIRHHACPIDPEADGFRERRRRWRARS